MDGGEEHDRDAAASFVVRPREADPVQPGHHQVDQNQGRPAPLGHAQRLVAVAGRQDAVPLADQQQLEQIAQMGIVVDDQDDWR